MADLFNNQIGAGWEAYATTGPSRIPTDADRKANAEAIRRGLPPVRHRVYMRYERLFDTWRVTFTGNGRTLRECCWENDATLEEAFRRGRALACLADRQAMEHGMSAGAGGVTLELDAEQYAALTSPP